MSNAIPLLQWYDALQKRLARDTGGSKSSNIREEDVLSAPSSLSHEAIRTYLLRRLQDLKLTAPFSWPLYFEEVRRSYVRTKIPIRCIVLKPTSLPQGIFAQLVAVAHSSTGDRAVERGVDSCQDITVTLLISQNADESRIERAVYHEMAHLELGHLWLASTRQSMTPELTTGLAVTPDPRHERDAELFTTILQRLAHGWDPGALPAPRLEAFFDLLG